MGYILFLDDVRRPRDMGRWFIEHTSVLRREDGTLSTLNMRPQTLVSYWETLRTSIESSRGLELMVAKNYAEFQCILEDHGLPALVSLDHDLCEEHYVDGFQGEAKTEGYKEKTGYDCALLLAEKIKAELPAEAHIYVIYHSMNPAGRQNMQAAIAAIGEH
jgi:hypothetical protein